jgi:hypothetical protein
MPDSVFSTDMIVTYRTSTLGFGRRLLPFLVEPMACPYHDALHTPYDAESDEFERVSGEFDL